MTPAEKAHLPKTVLIAWCVHCERPDYAFANQKEADDYDLVCPRCEHRQELVPATLVRVVRGTGEAQRLLDGLSTDADNGFAYAEEVRAWLAEARAALGGRQVRAQLSLADRGGAVLSPCRRYRYRLWRSWGDLEKRVAFVMLNPSTADESKDDPTIRKCVGFAKRWGFGALDVVNLFAWRSTDPDGLLDAADPVGPDNDKMVRAVFDGADRVVLAWGSHGAKIRKMVHARVRSGSLLSCSTTDDHGTLGYCADLSPRHPLMLAYATPFERQT
jgi:hypothetical protein